MGTGKKEAARKVRQGKLDDGMGNVKTKGENFYRYVFPLPQGTTLLKEPMWTDNHLEMQRR
jgi:nuclear GTP-binding protein